MRMLLLAAMLSLAGCTTMAEVDTTVRRNLPQICAAADTAYAGYVALTMRDRAEQKTARSVEAASLGPLCTDPSRATTAGVVAAAFAAYATMAAALDEARG